MPNKKFLMTVLVAGQRLNDADLICDSLEDFVAIKHEPHHRQLKHLSNMRHIPDRLFVILKQNFKKYGLMLKGGIREFEKPTFSPQREGKKMRTGSPSKYKRAKLKKMQHGRTLSKKVTKWAGL